MLDMEAIANSITPAPDSPKSEQASQDFSDGTQTQYEIDMDTLPLEDDLNEEDDSLMEDAINGHNNRNKSASVSC